MATGTVITNSGRKIILNRAYKVVPDYLAPTVFKVGTGTTTPTITDTDIETGVAIGGGATKAVAAGYPTLDETNFIATIRCLILTNECNGNSLTEFGLFNEDGAELMFSHAVHTAITKTSGVQITYVEKDKLE